MARDTQGITRRMRLSRYKAAEAPRNLDPKAPRKAFTVADNRSFTDEDGVKRYGGQRVMISERLANHLSKLGFINVDFDFAGDDALRDENAALKAELDRLRQIVPTQYSSTQAPDDTDEASDELDADPFGDEHSSGTDPAPDDEADDENPLPRKRRRSL
jgi:hypothetical protein